MSLQVAYGHPPGPTPPADYAPSLRSPRRAADGARKIAPTASITSISLSAWRTQASALTLVVNVLQWTGWPRLRTRTSRCRSPRFRMDAAWFPGTVVRAKPNSSGEKLEQKIKLGEFYREEISRKCLFALVEPGGIEPPTSCMPCRRSPS